jgi:hypothetical protein
MWYSHKTSSKYKVLDTFDIATGGPNKEVRSLNNYLIKSIETIKEDLIDFIEKNKPIARKVNAQHMGVNKLPAQISSLNSVDLLMSAIAIDSKFVCVIDLKLNCCSIRSRANFK